LETLDLSRRITMVLEWVKDALAEHQLTQKIRNDVTEGLEDRQREFLLRQQLEAIRKELGEDDDGLVDEYRAKLAALVEADAITEATRTAIEREIGRLERTPEQNMEHGWIRTWLDTVFEMPWSERTVDHLDVGDARRVLDADHTGLDEVKERIVEFLAVRKLPAERASGTSPQAERSGTRPQAEPKATSEDAAPGDTATSEDAAPGDKATLEDAARR